MMKMAQIPVMEVISFNIRCIDKNLFTALPTTRYGQA